jgi:hypothetical protein
MIKPLCFAIKPLICMMLLRAFIFYPQGLFIKPLSFMTKPALFIIKPALFITKPL